MSRSEIETGAGLSWLLKEFISSISAIVESATGTPPASQWHERGGLQALAEYADNDGGELLWWHQPLSHPDGASISVGAAGGVWADLGGYVTGVASDAATACRQSAGILLKPVAQGLTERLESRTECLQGWLEEPDSSTNRLFSIHLEHPALVRPLVVFGINQELLDVLAALDDADGAGQEANLDALREIEVPVVVTLGSVPIAISDALNLGPGSIVKLDCMAGELVDVSVGNSLIARGGIVVIDGNYGVRIEEILTARQRPRAEAAGHQHIGSGG